ncbi:hypothetical protein [Chitinivorax sp. B]|uniref:endo-beta-N-acetylglucosaminidase n=1 Tax=Chitinivorax sp. B TaxID=2502235 RepID=UPI0014854644|nr:hypothetical protein [Chitinivorax sp. B]
MSARTIQKKFTAILLPVLLATSGSVWSTELKTHTWALTAGDNSKQYPLLSDVNPDNLSGYIPPSTTSLATNLIESWHTPSSHVSDNAEKQFTAIYRIRPSVKTLSTTDIAEPVTFQNWAFIRRFIAFGGEASTGAHVFAPDPKWIDAAHRNGVKIYGTVFLADPAHGGHAGMVAELYGSRSGWDETSKASYRVGALDKLAAIAKKLNLDGWFINLESIGQDDRNQMTHIRSVMNYVLPEYRKQGVDFITYVPQNAGVIPVDIDDNGIANLGLTIHDNSVGIDAASVMSKYQNKSYLMFLDEPFWRNMPGSTRMLYRQAAAKSTACQFFQGTGQWQGFKYYTKMRYPAGADVNKLLCAGDAAALSTPNPETILTLRTPPSVYASVTGAGVTGPYKLDQFGCDDTGTTSLCQYLIPQDGNVNITLTSRSVFYSTKSKSWVGAIKYLNPNTLMIKAKPSQPSDIATASNAQLCYSSLSKTSEGLYQRSCTIRIVRQQVNGALNVYPGLNLHMDVGYYPQSMWPYLGE